MRSGAHDRIRSIQSGVFTDSGVCTGMSYFLASFGHGPEPDLFLRVVLMGDDGENVLVVLDQGIQAFIADVVVRENEYGGFSH